MSEITMHSVGFSPGITHSGEKPMLREYTVQQLRIRQPRAIGRAALLPRAIAAFAHRKDRTHLVQSVVRALHFHPGVLHSVSLAKYAVAGSSGACNSGLQYSRRRLKPQRLPRTLVQA